MKESKWWWRLIAHKFTDIELIADLVSGICCCAYIILPFIQYISMFNHKQYVNVVRGVWVHSNRPPFTFFFIPFSCSLHYRCCLCIVHILWESLKLMIRCVSRQTILSYCYHMMHFEPIVGFYLSSSLSQLFRLVFSWLLWTYFVITCTYNAGGNTHSRFAEYFYSEWNWLVIYIHSGRFETNGISKKFEHRLLLAIYSTIQKKSFWAIERQRSTKRSKGTMNNEYHYPLLKLTWSDISCRPHPAWNKYLFQNWHQHYVNWLFILR